MLEAKNHFFNIICIILDFLFFAYCCCAIIVLRRIKSLHRSRNAVYDTKKTS